MSGINNSLFDFLWNKNPKIKKTVVVKQFAEGGLKMIKLSAFIKALKSTWLRRILSSDSKWLEILKVYLDVEKLMTCNSAPDSVRTAVIYGLHFTKYSRN